MRMEPCYADNRCGNPKSDNIRFPECAINARLSLSQSVPLVNAISACHIKIIISKCCPSQES